MGYSSPRAAAGGTSLSVCIEAAWRGEALAMIAESGLNVLGSGVTAPLIPGAYWAAHGVVLHFERPNLIAYVALSCDGWAEAEAAPGGPAVPLRGARAIPGFSVARRRGRGVVSGVARGASPRLCRTSYNKQTSRPRGGPPLARADVTSTSRSSFRTTTTRHSRSVVSVLLGGSLSDQRCQVGPVGVRAFGIDSFSRRHGSVAWCIAPPLQGPAGGTLVAEVGRGSVSGSGGGLGRCPIPDRFEA